MARRRSGFTEIRRHPGSFIWWCAHGVALVVLCLITLGQGIWFWIIGAALMASNYIGQVVLNRRSRRTGMPTADRADIN